MKILAIASAGGHWIQLLRLHPAFDGNEVVYISTKNSFADMVKGCDYFTVPDASRWNKIKLIYSAFIIFKLVLRQKPKIIITTGAAPGLMAVLSGWILGIKTVWVDSIANVEEVSLSGRIALRFVTKIYTQWPELETTEIIFKGNVLS